MHREAIKDAARARAITIDSGDDLANAAEALQSVTQRQKLLAEHKSRILDPLAVAVKEIKALFAPAEALLNDAREFVREKMKDYDAKLQRLEQQQRAKLAAKGDTETEVVLRPSTVHTSSGGTVSFTTHEELVIVDESALPRRYLVPDTVAIRRALKAGIEVPGAKLVESRTPTTRT